MVSTMQFKLSIIDEKQLKFQRIIRSKDITFRSFVLFSTGNNEIDRQN